MAAYKSTPLKAVHCGRKLIKFDANGEYETSDSDEIKAISGALGIVETDKPEAEENEAEKADLKVKTAKKA